MKWSEWIWINCNLLTTIKLLLKKRRKRKMYFFITGQANPSKYRAEGQGSCLVLGFEPITFCSLDPESVKWFEWILYSVDTLFWSRTCWGAYLQDFPKEISIYNTKFLSFLKNSFYQPDVSNTKRCTKLWRNSTNF